MKENRSDLQDIGQRIRTARVECNLTQEELANKVGVARGTINYWERGSREPKIGDVIRLASELNTSCDYLLQGVHTENLNLFKETGLNESSIQALKNLNKDPQLSSKRILSLNLLLSSKGFGKFLDYIGQYSKHLKKASSISFKNAVLVDPTILKDEYAPKVKLSFSETQNNIENNNKRIDRQLDLANYQLFCMQKTLADIMQEHCKNFNIKYIHLK